MSTVTDNSIFLSSVSDVYAVEQPTEVNLNTAANLEAFNGSVGQLVKSLGADSQVDSLPSLIDLLVLMKGQVAALMLESKELRSLLEEAKAELAIDKSIEELEKLESDRRCDIVGKLQAIFQPLLLAISCVAVIIAPTPITVGLLLFSIAMYADEQIASATDNDSLLTTLTSKLESQLSEILPPNVAQILAPIVVVFAMVAVSVLAAKGGMSVASKFGNFPGFDRLKSLIAAKMGDLLSDPAATKQLAQKIINHAILAGALAEQTIVVTNSTFQYQTAKFQQAIDSVDADISVLEQMSSLLDKALSGFMSDYRQSKAWSVS